MRKITLGDLCEPIAGQLKLEKDTLVDYFDISSVDNVSKTITGFTTYNFGEAPSRARKAVKRNSILVSTVRPNLNAVALFDEETDNIPVASTGFCVLDCKMGVDPRFIFNFCRSKPFIDEMTSQATGASYPAVSDKIVRGAKIPDYSEKEQAEISDTLDCVAEVIEMRKRELQKLDDLIKARFVELFGNTKNKVLVGEMCNVTGGYSFKSDDISNDGAIKILQIGNVYLDNVNWETVNYLPKGYDEKYSRFLLNEGDIVVALTRPIIQSLGNVKACIVKSSDLPCLLNQRVGRIVPKEDKSVLLEFIYGCLMTDDFTRYVESCSIGCSQPNISTKDIENYLIPNATYEEQTKYVEFKRQTDKSKVAETLIQITTLYMTLTHPKYNLREVTT